VATNGFQDNDPTEASQLLPTPHMYLTQCTQYITDFTLQHT